MILMNFIKKRWSMGKRLPAVVMAMMMESMLIQRLESNGSFCLGLVCVKNIHPLIGVGDHIPDTLLFDHAHVPLWKKG
jgi:hypothetical protein